MSSMFCNVGPVERIVRLLGAGAAAIPVISGRQPRHVRKWLAVTAAAEVFTAFARFCPLNLILGIDNCPRRGALGTVAYRGASLLPGGRLAYGAVEALGSATRTVGGAATSAATGLAGGVAGGAASAVASGATSAAKAFASGEDDDDDASGDNFSMLLAAGAALAIAAGFSFAMNSTRAARQAAAAATVRGGGDARRPATDSLAPTLRTAMDSPTGEATNSPG